MDYRLKPLGTTCAATGEPLLPGETVHSVATASTDVEDGFDRVDYSENGWQSLDPETTDSFLAVWKAVVPPPVAKKAGLDVDEQMLRFEQLAEEDAPHQGPLLYVLALWLVRKRRLKIEGSFEEDGVERLKLNGVRGEGIFEIRDQTLGMNDIAALQAALLGEEPPEDETMLNEHEIDDADVNANEDDNVIADEESLDEEYEYEEEEYEDDAEVEYVDADGEEASADDEYEYVEVYVDEDGNEVEYEDDSEEEYLDEDDAEVAEDDLEEEAYDDEEYEYEDEEDFEDDDYEDLQEVAA